MGDYATLPFSKVGRVALRAKRASSFVWLANNEKINGVTRRSHVVFEIANSIYLSYYFANTD